MYNSKTGYSKAVDKKRLNFILDQLYKHIPPGSNVLDVGCGNGIMSIAIGNNSFNVHGVDVSSKAIAKANTSNTTPNVNFEVVSATDLVVDGRMYDAVVCSEVLEHLDSPSLLLDTLYQLLSPSGVLIVTVPNGRGPRELLITKPMQTLQKRQGLLLTIAELFKKALGYQGITEQSDADDLTHIQFFTKGDLKQQLGEKNFEMVAFGKANFLADVFPFSSLANRIYFLQTLDCRLADWLPHHFTCGFYSAWSKVPIAEKETNKKEKAKENV